MNLFSLLILIFWNTFNWQPFICEEGGFQLDVPGVMKHSVQQISTDIGSINYHSYHYVSHNDTSGNYAFIVSYYKSPSIRIPIDSTNLLTEFFEATVEQAVLTVSGEVLILDDIKYQNRYPGKFWRIHYNDGLSVMKTKVYLVEDSFYSIQVAVDASLSLNYAVDRFIDSFKLTNVFN